MRRARASFITLLAAGLASGCGSHESCLEVSDTPIGCGGAEVERIASFPDRGGGDSTG